MFRPLAIAAVVLISAVPALAQSSLGLTGGELRLGYSDLDGASGFVSLKADVAVTEFHGLQGDLHLSDTVSGTIGTLAAHAYLTPHEGQKYGLFTFVGDVGGRSATYGGGGIEGLFALSPQTAVEARAGLGLTHRTGFDFLFAEIGLSHDIAPWLSVHTGIGLAEYDEAGFSAMAYQISAGIDYRPQGQPFGVFAELTHDRLTGQNAQPGQTEFRAGLSLSFGTTRRGGPETRSFTMPDPLDPLTRRGLF